MKNRAEDWKQREKTSAAKTGPGTIPQVVQLPGGIKLQAVAFEIIEYDAEGRPLTFQIRPNDTPPRPGVWRLFADDTAIRRPGQQLDALCPRGAWCTHEVLCRGALRASTPDGPEL